MALQNNRIEFSITQNETKTHMRDLMVKHIEEVWNNFDESARSKVMKEIYHEDLSWSVPEEYPLNETSIFQGRDKICAMISEEHQKLPGCFIKIDDDYMAVSHNMGIVHWTVCHPEHGDLVKACHVIVVEEGKIKAFWTMHLQMPGGESSKVTKE